MGESLTEEAQKRIDQTISSVVAEYKKEFEEFTTNLGSNVPYHYSPMELFQLNKLVVLKMGMDHLKVRISNEVKELLNEFINQVNTIALEKTKTNKTRENDKNLDS